MEILKNICDECPVKTGCKSVFRDMYGEITSDKWHGTHCDFYRPRAVRVWHVMQCHSDLLNMYGTYNNGAL